MSTVYLTTEQVGEQIGRSADKVRRLCAQGHLAATKLGDEWRIHPDAVDAFMRPTNIVKPQPNARLSARQRRRSA